VRQTTALIESRELPGIRRQPEDRRGERIDVTVATVGDQVTVNRMVKKARVARCSKQALTIGTVEGKITGTNKGGFDVQVSGFRAFCPISQIDRIYCSDPQSFVGKTLPFRIIEYKEGGRRIVISRRIRKRRSQKGRGDAAAPAGVDEIDGTVRPQPLASSTWIDGWSTSRASPCPRHGPGEAVQVATSGQGSGSRSWATEERAHLALGQAGDPWAASRTASVATCPRGVLRLRTTARSSRSLFGVDDCTRSSRRPEGLPPPGAWASQTVEVRCSSSTCRKTALLVARLDRRRMHRRRAGAKLSGMAVAGRCRT
jgi:hypothetical protein